jgi:hypothetical protein
MKIPSVPSAFLKIAESSQNHQVRSMAELDPIGMLNIMDFGLLQALLMM